MCEGVTWVTAANKWAAWLLIESLIDALRGHVRMWMLKESYKLHVHLVVSLPPVFSFPLRSLQEHGSGCLMNLALTPDNQRQIGDRSTRKSTRKARMLKHKSACTCTCYATSLEEDSRKQQGRTRTTTCTNLPEHAQLCRRSRRVRNALERTPNPDGRGKST